MAAGGELGVPEGERVVFDPAGWEQLAEVRAGPGRGADFAGRREDDGAGGDPGRGGFLLLRGGGARHMMMVRGGCFDNRRKEVGVSYAAVNPRRARVDVWHLVFDRARVHKEACHVQRDFSFRR